MQQMTFVIRRLPTMPMYLCSMPARFPFYPQTYTKMP